MDRKRAGLRVLWTIFVAALNIALLVGLFLALMSWDKGEVI